jgi:ribose transport system substrate-binding protein
MTGRFERKGRWLSLAAGLASLAVVAAACSSAATTAPSAAAVATTAPSAAAAKYVIGIADNVVGNGWRDEMACAVMAQAKASGQVSKVINASANGSASDEIQAMRSLISAGVNAIIVNPADPQALNSVIDEANAKGIVVVAVDQSVTSPNAYVFTNDQVAYGRLSTEWLIKQLNDKGTILEFRGAPGSSADTDRHAGLEQALAGHPNIKVISVVDNWNLGTMAQIMSQELASGTKIDGISGDGGGQVIWQAYAAAKKPYVPTAVSDNNGDLQGVQTPGLKIVAVGNPAVVGGAGVTIALNALQGKSQQKVTKFTPTAWDSTTPDGLAAINAAWDSRLNPYYSTTTSIPGLTTFTKEDLLACQGPQG